MYANTPIIVVEPSWLPHTVYSFQLTSSPSFLLVCSRYALGMIAYTCRFDFR